MKNNIMVTGVGGGVGQSLLKALAKTDFGIVAVDSEALATGLHASPKAHLVPYAADSQYIPSILDICRTQRCDLIFVGHDVELMPLSANLELFRSNNIIPVVSSQKVIRICDDKLATQLFLEAHGFSTPKTCKFTESSDFNGPVVLKPQYGGARSKNTYVVRTRHELEVYSQLIETKNCIVQEYIEGDEFTCGSVTLDGKCHGVIVMRRILRDGDTYKAFVVRDSMLEDAVATAAEALGAFGACNFQLRVRDGVPYIFEINARCSGTTAARALAGFNEPKMIADYLLRGCLPKYEIQEISILRYWNELPVSNDRISRLEKTGNIIGDGKTL